jgi:2-oxoglutarate ferredoxin oxidoreductase subunit delta
MEGVKILPQYCKGCGFCVRNCPGKVLEVADEVNALGYKYARPVRAQDCTSCRICAIICPDAAVEVYK